MQNSHYSIKDLENLTSIKAHTIRIWEQRYNILEPLRTETNIRYYLDEHLKKLLNVNLLYINGYKISAIAQLSNEEILKEVKSILNKKAVAEENLIQKLIEAVLNFDPSEIQEIIQAYNEKFGVETTYLNLILPTLFRVGELWQVSTLNVAHEHLFSNTIKEFLIGEVVKVKARNNKSTVILFLHENEEHEISLLYTYYILKKNGHNCIYLGQRMPLNDLKLIYENVKPDYVFSSFITRLTETKFEKLITELLDFIPASKIKLSGYAAKKNESKLPKKIEFIEDANQITKYFV